MEIFIKNVINLNEYIIFLFEENIETVKSYKNK